jgi:hypothetical protein
LPQKGAKVAKKMKTETEVFDVVNKIRQIGYELHGYLRHGHLEKVYENGIAH